MNEVAEARASRRLRHPLKFRHLQVAQSRQLSPHMIRITLQGPALHGFLSPGFDDHVKLFFPDPDTGHLSLPTAGPDGPQFAVDRPRPVARDYTPRAFDEKAETLSIDFAVHEAGPATRWALNAQPGDSIGVGGPRGSFLIPADFDAHLLIGDDTALPAIARRLAELPAGARVTVVDEVEGPEHELAFDTSTDLSLHWVHRRGAAAGSPKLVDALKRLSPNPGDFHTWVACESGVAKVLRQELIAHHGAGPQWTKAAGYWKHGNAATHDKHE